MIREGGFGATAFCGNFTSATTTQTAVLPTYASLCTDNAVAQISSACTCLQAVVSSMDVIQNPTLTISATYPGASNLMFYSPAACPGGWETAGLLYGLGGVTFASETSAFLCCPMYVYTLLLP